MTTPHNIPRLRFPEFEGEWVEKRIGDVLVSSFSGGTPATTQKAYYGGIIPFIRSAEIDKTTTELTLTERGIENSSARIVKQGDLLIALYGANSGEVAISKIDGAINQAILCLRTKSSNYFLYYTLFFKQSHITGKYLQGGQGNLSADIIKSISIYWPTLPEQQKIAATLTSLDEKLAAATEKLEALKVHKRGLMQKLFPAPGETLPAIRFAGFEGEWVEKRIGEVFRTTRGQVLSMRLVKKEPKGAYVYPVYSSQTKSDGLAGYYNSYLFEEAITWTTDGANAGEVKYRKGKFFCTNVCGVLLNDQGFANGFIAESLNLVTRNYVSYVGNPKLMNGVMETIPILIPTLPEQQKIASCLSSLDEIISLQQEQVEALKTYKKGLMQGLFPAPEGQ